ncbi:MAG: hypothetical protein U0325_23730 [Polyangiales bacterium]
MGDLLRGHVERRADAARGAVVLLVEQVRRDAEVEDLHPRRAVVGVGDEEVRGLEVAVHDALRVHLVERAGDLLQERGDGARRDARALVPLPLDELREVLALQELHHQKGDRRGAVDVAVDDLHDVVAVDARAGGGLAVEPLDARGVREALGVQELQREAAPRELVLDLVDLGHPAAAEATDQAVTVREHGARRQRAAG